MQNHIDKNEVFTDSDYQDSERVLPAIQGIGGTESADYNKYPLPVGGKKHYHSLNILGFLQPNNFLPDLPGGQNNKKNPRFKSSYLEAGDLKKISFMRANGSTMVDYQNSGLITHEDEHNKPSVLTNNRLQSNRPKSKQFFANF